MTLVWNEESEAKLKKLWSESLPASQIAVELGAPSRNAILGKVHRLGLAGRKKKFGEAGATPKSARAAATANSSEARRPKITLAAVKPKLPAQRVPEKVSIWIALPAPPQRAGDFGPRTILDLGRRHCRFPLFKGHEPMEQKFYCGEPKFDGSYCKHHAALCAGVGTPGERRAHLEAAE